MNIADIDDTVIVSLAKAWIQHHPSRPGVVEALWEMGATVDAARARVNNLIDEGLLQFHHSPDFARPTLRGLGLLSDMEDHEEDE